MKPICMSVYALAQPESGVMVGNYRLLRQLGGGGSASVYLAEHLSHKRQVALKLLNLSIACHEEIQRFLSEARLLASMRHPHIVRALDFGWEQGTPFLAMEYAPGGTIQQVLSQGVTLPVIDILPAIVQIASALQYAHHHSVIHRDVKPENILLGPHNKIWLTDFGISTTTSAELGVRDDEREARGTITYMAPEVINGNPLPASDQYALAVMVYEWLCGQPPFKGSIFEVCMHHMYTPPARLQDHVSTISPAVERVVLKALAKDPQQRYAYVQEFAAAFKQATNEKCFPWFSHQWLALHNPEQVLPVISPVVSRMATHGRGGLERWIMGSVTKRVLQATTLPMLVVQPPQMGALQKLRGNLAYARPPH